MSIDDSLSDYHRRRLDALTYMWGALTAGSATSPEVRKAMLAAIEIAVDDGYLSADDAATYRARLDEWRVRFTSPDRGPLGPW